MKTSADDLDGNVMGCFERLAHYSVEVIPLCVIKSTNVKCKSIIIKI